MARAPNGASNARRSRGGGAAKGPPALGKTLTVTPEGIKRSEHNVSWLLELREQLKRRAAN